MWRAALPCKSHGLAAAAFAALVLAAVAPAAGAQTADPAGSTGVRAPSSVWAVSLPAGTPPSLSQLRWLRQQGITSVIAPAGPRTRLNALARAAGAARLTVISPARTAPKRPCARGTGVLRTCAAWAPTPAAAATLARRSLVDFVVVSVRTAAQLAPLRQRLGPRTRVIAVVPLSSTASGKRTWTTAVSASEGAPSLGIAVAATATPSPVLRAYLASLPQARTAAAIPPAPGRLGAAATTPTTVSLTWDPVPGATGYGIYREGTLFVNVEGTSYTAGGLACGRSHSFAVDAFGTSGRSGKATASATTPACPAPAGGGSSGGGSSGGSVDILPPTAPLGLTRTSFTATSLTVGWTAATDNVAVAQYGRYRNGVLVSSGAGTSATFTGLSCGSTYVIGIDAVDAAGNRSTTTSASFATGACPTGGGADTQAPSVPQNQSLTAAQTSVTMTWSASTDNVGVTGYRLFRDGSAVATASASPYTFTGLSCGTSYTFALEAYDAAGNASNRALATGSASTTACAAPPPPPPSPPSGSTTANLWVDTNGGTCVRQATRGAYSDAQACSWNGAYQAAQTGDLILIRGGNYGDVTIGPNKASIAAPGVTFQPVSGESVVVVDLENGYYSGGASNITFSGPVAARTFRSDGASNITVDGWTVDCNGCDNVQIFHLESADNVLVRNSDIGDNNNNSLIWINGSNITFDNNVIHDAGLPSGSGAHTECMYVWNVSNLRLTRNHFYHCSVMDVFITGASVASGGFIENNIFEKPWENTGVISNSAYSFHFRTGGSPSPDPSNWDFRYNTFVGPLSINTTENPVGAGGMRVIGNVFLSGAPCGHANTTYSHNVFASGGCGSNAYATSLATLLAGFVDSGSSPGDYRLRATSVLLDRGNGSDHPGSDKNGGSRPVGGAPDAGADEYGN